jgi:hypothetical protein
MESGYRLTRARTRRLESELDRIRRFVDLAAVRFKGGYLKTGG